METLKTVTGAEKANAYLKLGWKRVHVFTKPFAWSDDGNLVTECDAAFVLVWDSSQGEPIEPKQTVYPEPT